MDKNGTKNAACGIIRTVLPIAGILLAALILLFLIHPDPFHELLARVALDVEPLPPPRTSRAGLSTALGKIRHLHAELGNGAAPPAESGGRPSAGEPESITFSDEEMNSYVAYRMSRHRAGRLPAAVREAIDHARIAFTDGGFRIEGNVDLSKLAGYLEGRLGVVIPEAYRRKTTFLVAGAIRAEHGLGRVTITEDSLGRIPAAAGGLIPQSKAIARRLIASTLIEDTLEAKVTSEDELTFALPPWIDGVRARRGELEIILSPER